VGRTPRPERVVVGLGGNAILRRGQAPEAQIQRRNLHLAAAQLAALAEGRDLVVTHGNGPQVGLLALQAAAFDSIHPYPLDVLGAESEGMLGYMIEQALRNRLPGRPLATLLTQVQVDPADPAFAYPTKPIGPVYSRAQAERLGAERGWRLVPDGDRWRRAVPSPEPLRILEIETIRLLVDAGALVICAGGGGVPVVMTEVGAWIGVEAVVDKDLATALLAIALDADRLVLLTDVAAVCRGWGTPESQSITQAGVHDLRALEFESGTMAPKVEAACRFAQQTGRPAAIGALESALAVLQGTAGTRITAG
jgi:carbamate kinase